ncbi:hypothetical protein [Streptomyces sp. CRN 30]|uniref:hypothetical protein n=1 Tax=Streptomyces sp. CRN 30 TaxID=3075613 RepID=UPI002A7F360B|nr:hypothetical protein [Streptomyces sp. CRN 30]
MARPSRRAHRGVRHPQAGHLLNTARPADLPAALDRAIGPDGAGPCPLRLDAVGRRHGGRPVLTDIALTVPDNVALSA